MKKVSIISILIAFSQSASAEVLDKFHGCNTGSVLPILVLFLALAAISRFLSNKLFITILTISLIFIFIYVIRFLTYTFGLPANIFFDDVWRTVVDELANCRRYKTIGYWVANFIWVIFYFISVRMIYKKIQPRARL